MSADGKLSPYSLWQLVQYMAKLGTIGFGGPVALVGDMHRDLVEQRQWISESEERVPPKRHGEAVIVLGKRSITDIPTFLILLAASFLLWKVKKLPEPAIVALAAAVGLLVYPMAKG